MQQKTQHQIQFQKQKQQLVQKEDLMVSGTTISVSSNSKRVQQQKQQFQQVVPVIKPPAQKIKQQQQQTPIKAIKKTILTSIASEMKIVQPIIQETENSIDSSPEPKFLLSQYPIAKSELAAVVLRKVPIRGEVIVKYSHYKDKFPIVDGVLRESDIDDQYCLSSVFKGDYQFQIRLEKDIGRKYLPKLVGGWNGVEVGNVYILEVDEDPMQLEFEKANSKMYVAYKPEEKKNRKVDEITDQLKGMSIEQIQAKGEQYRQLVEARDLEDILYK